jgi:hypothetical protein
VWCRDTCLSAWNAGRLRIQGNPCCQWLQAQTSTGLACIFMEALFVEQQVPIISQRIEKRAKLKAITTCQMFAGCPRLCAPSRRGACGSIWRTTCPVAGRAAGGAPPPTCRQAAGLGVPLCGVPTLAASWKYARPSCVESVQLGMLPAHEVSLLSRHALSCGVTEWHYKSCSKGGKDSAAYPTPYALAILASQTSSPRRPAMFLGAAGCVAVAGGGGGGGGAEPAAGGDAGGAQRAQGAAVGQRRPHRGA